MHIKFVLVKSMSFLLTFFNVKPHLNERIGTESRNSQIKQALTKCEG